MTINVDPLLAPISADTPAGQDIRDTPEYDTIAAEIEKLSNPSSSGQIDWQVVESLGTQLFATQGKDFMVAAWVGAAWTLRHEVNGLHASLVLQEGLLQNYWDTAYPPLKRLRGRRNALAWWVERTVDWLASAEIVPLAGDVHQAMLQTAIQLDTLLSEHDPDAEPLRPLIEHIRRLDVIAAPDPATTDSPALDTGDTPGGDTATTIGHAALQAEAAHTATSAATPASSDATVPSPAAASPAAMPTFDQAKPKTMDELVDAMSPALQHLGTLASGLRALNPFNPLCIDLTRFAARSTLLNPPPANDQLTAFMPPAAPIMDAYESLVQNGNTHGLIEFCESRISMHPCWLDLDYQSARCYGQQGESGHAMQQAIVQNVLAFTARLPGIEHLKFSDGLPFANADTLQWLLDCRATGQADPASPDGTPQQNLLHQAVAAAQAGRPNDALALYQSAVQSSWSARDRFQARLAQAALRLKMPGSPVLLDLITPLLKECKQRRLADWEPELAIQVWQLYRQAAEKVLADSDQDDDSREEAEKAHHKASRKLASLDISKA